MKWILAKGDQLPKDSEVVLLCVNKKYYIAEFDGNENIFKLKDQIGSYFRPQKEQIYWAKFVGPEKEKKSP